MYGALSVCMSTYVSYALLCQKRASDPTRNSGEPPCGCWELNSLEEQSVLLTAEPSLQPLFVFEVGFFCVALAVLELTL